MTAADIVRAFAIDPSGPYFDVTPISTRDIGFSAQRNYPAQSRFKPPIRADGTQDTVVLLAVRFSPESTATPSTRVPLEIYASVYPRYISNHFDYDYSDPGSPTEHSVRVSRSSPRPIDISIVSKYAIDTSTLQLFDSDSHVVSGQSILDDAYNSHTGTVDTLRGSIMRWRIASRTAASALCPRGASVVQWFLRHLFGRELAPADPLRPMFGRYSPDDMKRVKGEDIDIFGYRASKPVILSYFVLLLLAYAGAMVFGVEPRWVEYLMDNQLLSLAMSVVALAVLDTLIPRLLLNMVNWLNSARYKLLTGRVRY